MQPIFAMSFMFETIVKSGGAKLLLEKWDVDVANHRHQALLGLKHLFENYLVSWQNYISQYLLVDWRGGALFRFYHDFRDCCHPCCVNPEFKVGVASSHFPLSGLRGFEGRRIPGVARLLLPPGGGAQEDALVGVVQPHPAVRR